MRTGASHARHHAVATLDELQKAHEVRISGLVTELVGRGGESDLALVRALIHRAVHLVAERKVVEFCGVATFLGEMIGHAHQLLHGADQSAPAHKDVVH
jgi:hypothetical protein